MFGEGSSIVVLEELDHALNRNAKIYAEVFGYGTAFDPKNRNICNSKATGATAAIKASFDDAKIQESDIDYVSASANSTLDCDAMEAQALKNVFGDRSKEVPVSSVKSMIGECFSAAGAMNMASSIGILETGFIHPTINYEKSDRRCELNCVPNKAKEASVNKILINSFSPTGSSSSLVIGKLANN